MAVRFTTIDQSMWERWVPDYRGERELFKARPDEAMSMEVRFMTLAERKRHERVAAQMFRGAISDDRGDEYMAELFGSHVRDVRNLIVGDTPITTGDELLAFLVANGESDLAYAITEALAKRSSLEAGLAKKLRCGSDSGSSVRSRSANGGARDATQVSPSATLGEAVRSVTYDYQTQTSDASAGAIDIPIELPTTGPESTT
jgi:hypothetical protein